MAYLADMIGVLLNSMFVRDTDRVCHQYDKDFLGNKRVEVCGTLMAQQLRNALCPLGPLCVCVCMEGGPDVIACVAS